MTYMAKEPVVIPASPDQHESPPSRHVIFSIRAMTLEESLHEQLLHSSPIGAIVGARIWHGRLPPNSFAPGLTQPALTYWRVSSNRLRTEDPKIVGNRRSRFQLDCWAKADIDVWDLCNAVRRELEGFRGDLGGSGGIPVSAITFENCRDMFEPKTGIHHVPMDFFIFHAQPILS